MLSSEEFKNWGKNVVLFAHVTTHIEGRKNDDMLGKKGGQGWPHIVALDANGDVTAKAGGRSVEGFAAMIESGKKYTAIATKAEKTSDDKLFLLEHALDMGSVDAAEATKQLAAIEGVAADKKKGVEARIFDLAIAGEVPKTRLGREEFEKFRIDAGKKFAGWMKEGKEPSGSNPGIYARFFEWMMAYAESEKNADLFETCIDKLRAKFDNPNAKKFLDAQQKKLEEMRKGSDDAEDGNDDEDEDGGM